MIHPEEVQNMVKYMDKFGVDKKGFEQALLRTLLVIAETINEYQKVTNILYDRHELAKLVNQFYYIIVESGSQLTNEIFKKDVKEILGILERDKKKTDLVFPREIYFIGIILSRSIKSLYSCTISDTSIIVLFLWCISSIILRVILDKKLFSYFDFCL